MPPTSQYGGSSFTALNDYIPPPGVLGWSISPIISAGFTSQIPSNTVIYNRIYVPTGGSASNISVYVDTGGAGLTANQTIAGLYDASGNLLGFTPDQSVNWGTSGVKTMPLTQQSTGSLLLLGGSYYYGAILANGTTMPVMGRNPGTTGTLTNFGTPATRPVAVVQSGRTSLPATVTYSGLPPNLIVFWAALT